MINKNTFFSFNLLINENISFNSITRSVFNFNLFLFSVHCVLYHEFSIVHIRPLTFSPVYRFTEMIK